MSEEPSKPPLDADLEREIQEALGETSLLGVSPSHPPPHPQARATADPPTTDEPTPGAFAEARVSGVGAEDVFVEFGPRAQGVIPADQFGTPPTIGEQVRVYVEKFDLKEGLFLCALKRALHAASGWDSVERGAVVVATVRAVNKGGLTVQVGHLTGFLPASHLALEHVEDLETAVGRTFPVEVIESDPDRKKLVVSRRAVLARERDEKRASTLETLQPGDVLKGPVTRIEKFGAFVDLGGLDGLVHVSQMSWQRVEHPDQLLKVGDVVEVQILDVKLEEGRVGLGMKQLQQDPWIAFTTTQRPGSVVPGKVTRLASYGAFIELAPGIEGLAHVSELAPGSVGSAREVVKVGQEVAVRIVSIEPERRRIALSLLTERGDRLTDDVADDATIREVLSRGRAEEPEPTLGDLLKKALEGRGDDRRR